MRTSVAILALVIAGIPVLAQDAAPLPDAAGFLQQVRQHLRDDDAVRRQYIYTVHETETKLDKNGKPASAETNVSEVYPAADGVPEYKRVLVRDGVPLTAKQLEQSDRKHQQEVLDYVHARGRESAGDRQRRAAKDAEGRREQEAKIDELFRVYDVRLAGRELLEGRSTIVFTFTPRPGVKATSREGSIMQKFSGKAWIDEQDFQVSRVEAKAFDDVSVGLGLVARLYAGSSLRLERRKINNEAWMLSRVDFVGNGRVMLFRRLAIHVVNQYSDYRKYTVSTATSFSQDQAR